jgi:hypothetical protein
MFCSFCHCRRGLLGEGMAEAWGTEEPRFGDVARLGFCRYLDRRSAGCMIYVRDVALDVADVGIYNVRLG